MKTQIWVDECDDEPRYQINEQKLTSWLHDAIANGQLQPYGIENPERAYDISIEEAVELLNSTDNSNTEIYLKKVTD